MNADIEQRIAEWFITSELDEKIYLSLAGEISDEPTETHFIELSNSRMKLRFLFRREVPWETLGKRLSQLKKHHVDFHCDPARFRGLMDHYHKPPELDIMIASYTAKVIKGAETYMIEVEAVSPELHIEHMHDGGKTGREIEIDDYFGESPWASSGQLKVPDSDEIEALRRSTFDFFMRLCSALEMRSVELPFQITPDCKFEYSFSRMYNSYAELMSDPKVDLGRDRIDSYTSTAEIFYSLVYERGCFEVDGNIALNALEQGHLSSLIADFT